MMTTMHRRRQYRDRRAQPTLADLMKADMFIGVHIALTGFFFALLLLVVIFGDRFIGLFFGG